LQNPGGKRKNGRPKMRWMDGVEDLRNLDVVNWKPKAQKRDGWRTFLQQTKTHKYCSANNNVVNLQEFIKTYIFYFSLYRVVHDFRA
jgi:hypothetical protein